MNREHLEKIGCDVDKFENLLLNKIIKGIPTELTEASLEVMKLRELLTSEDVYFWDNDNETDFGGSVYWSPDKRVVLVSFKS